MKTFKLLTILFATLCFAAMISCEGPAGADGEIGPAGADGTNGTDGTDGTNGSDGTIGVDGNVTCLECHTLANMTAIDAQYELSTHNLSNLMYNGQTVYEYAGGRQSCAACHSHEGFTETQWTGADTTLEEIPYPHAIRCNTCHGGHTTFDFENDGHDYALTTMDPVTIRMDESASVIDFEGTSNLCANCHQPLTEGPDVASADSFNITSPYWGPHHGPQSTVILGYGAVEFSGSETYPIDGSAAHFDLGCTGCHMTEYNATDETGGHTWHPGINACTGCHASATDFDINGFQTEISTLLGEIEVLLEAEGVLSGGHLVAGKYDIDFAAGYYNWVMFGHEDKSHGAHNPGYTKAVLTNTKEVLTGK